MMDSFEIRRDDPGLTAAIARHFITQGDYLAAEKTLAAAPKADSASIEAVLVELAAAIAGTDPDGASRTLARVADRMARNASYWRAAAAVAQRLEDRQAARTALEKIVELEPTDASGWMRLGKAAMNANDFSRAEQAYLTAAEAAGPSSVVLTVADRLRRVPAAGQPVRIAIVGSTTLDPLRDYLEVRCRADGLSPEVYLSPFGQFAEEILNGQSGLYAFEPEVVIVSISAQALFPDFYDGLWKASVSDRAAAIDEIILRADRLLRGLQQRTSALILMDTFLLPRFAPLGILDRREELGQSEFYATTNTKLAKRVREEFPAVQLIDMDRLASDIGKRNATDPKMWHVARIAHSHQALEALSSAYMGAIKALTGRSRKCIVVDLDNTLWGGVIGEDGISGIQLGGDGLGGAFLLFQQSLLQMWERGILLAVNSKNNVEDAMSVLDGHPEMVLRTTHFAALRVNWIDKATNLQSIAGELNIGLDSLVFMDDSPAECALVRTALPQVHTVQLPSDPSLYRGVLLELNDFTSLSLTEEDLTRGRIYTERRERQVWESGISNALSDHLMQLGLVVTVDLANEFTIPRVAQLIGKTNQFNLTTPRYTESAVRTLAESASHIVATVTVSDRFGSHGVVGTAIVETGASECRLDTFLLSCRVLGRGVETALLSEVALLARGRGANTLRGTFIATAKNEPARSFLADCGFSQDLSDPTRHDWILSLDNPVAAPSWITLESKLR